jgi:hypothetical protein
MLDRLTCLRSSEQNFVENIFSDGGENIFISCKIFVQIQINPENYTLKQKNSIIFARTCLHLSGRRPVMLVGRYRVRFLFTWVYFTEFANLCEE